VGDAERPELEKRVRRAAPAPPSDPSGVAFDGDFETLGRLADSLQTDSDRSAGSATPRPRRPARALALPVLAVVALGLLLALAWAVV